MERVIILAERLLRLKAEVFFPPIAKAYQWIIDNYSNFGASELQSKDFQSVSNFGNTSILLVTANEGSTAKTVPQHPQKCCNPQRFKACPND